MADLSCDLIDAHVHLVWEGQSDPAHYTILESPVMTSYRAARSAWQNLTGGVTTVRDLGGAHNIPIELAKAVKQGMPGSRILGAGAGDVVQTGEWLLLCVVKPMGLMKSAKLCANR